MRPQRSGKSSPLAAPSQPLNRLDVPSLLSESESLGLAEELGYVFLSRIYE